MTPSTGRLRHEALRRHVVRTDIHHPTDSTLLWDVVRVIMRLIGRLDVVRGTPLRSPHELVPAYERSLCSSGVRVPEFDQHISSNVSHGTI